MPLLFASRGRQLLVAAVVAWTIFGEKRRSLGLALTRMRRANCEAEVLNLNALARIDMTQKPALSIFARALVEQRARHGYSRHAIANHCGVSTSKIAEWEDGTGIPDPQTFKRLRGMLPRLIATPPNWGPQPFGSIADREVAKVKAEAAAIKPEPKPEPEEFGDALRRIRKAQGMTQKELGAVFGLVGSAITNWEQGSNGPTSENISRLYDLLPELKAAVDAGTVKAPIVREFSVKPGRKTNAPIAIVKEIATTTAPVIVAPLPANDERKAPTLDELAAQYGKARAGKLRKQRELDELRGKIADLSHEVERLAAEEDRALAALDAVAAEPGK